MLAVYQKELKTYFNGMIGAIFIGFILLMTGIFMVSWNLFGLYPSFEYTVINVTIVYMFAIPVLTMRSFAEEKHSRTDQLLYSLPMNMTSIVMAKFLAMVTILAVPVLVMCLYPLILGSFGAVNYVSAYGAILAYFLLGAALIAVGMFISSLTESQVIAAVITLAVMLLINFMSSIASMVPTTAAASLAGLLALSIIAALIVHVMIKNQVVSLAVAVVLSATSLLVFIIDPTLIEGLIPKLLMATALFDRMMTFQNGIFDLTALFFYISVSVLFVYLTVQSMEKKRWN